MGRMGAILSHILTLPHLPYQPGQIFVVQNGLYMCPGEPKDLVTLERGHLSLFRYPTRGNGTYLGRGELGVTRLRQSRQEGGHSHFDAILMCYSMYKFLSNVVFVKC